MPTVRLLQVLATYCRELRPAGVGDLRAALQAGQYPWLREELAAVIGDRVQGAAWWNDAIGRDAANPPATKREVRAEHRLLWRSLFPDEPFPT